MIKRTLTLLAGVMLVASVAACSSHRAARSTQTASAADATPSAVVVAEAPTTPVTKGEY